MNIIMSTDRNGQPRGIINVTPFVDLEGVHKIICKFMDEMITQQVADM